MGRWKRKVVRGQGTVRPEPAQGERRRSWLTWKMGGAVLLALPSLGLFLFVHEYGVNACFWDAIDFMPVFQKYHSGTLDFSYLLTQHNEHRILTTRVAVLLLGLATQYDNVAEMYLIAVLMTGTLAVFLFQLRDVLFRDRNVLWYLPVPWVLLSLRQYQNFLSGVQMTYVMVSLFAVLAFAGLRLVARRGEAFWEALPLPLVCAVFSSYSCAQGLLVWPAGLVQILLSKMEWRGKRLLVASWVVTGLTVWGLYFRDYTSPGHHPSIKAAFSDPIAAIYFFLTLLGNSLAWSEMIAFPAGIALLSASAVAMFLVVRYGDGDRDPMWFALIVFGCLILGSITVGRFGFGMKYTAESRYATYSLLVVIGTYLALMEFVIRRRQGVPFAAAILYAMFLVSVPFSVLHGLQAGEGTREGRQARAQVLRWYRYMPDEALASMIYPNPKTARERAEYLERMRYNVFAER